MHTNNLTVHAVLAPIRNHAKLAPLARLNVDATAILIDTILAMRGADRHAKAHVAETLQALMPRLYDMWDAAAHAYYHNPKLTWLAPLARSGRFPEGWDYEAYPEGPEPLPSDAEDGWLADMIARLN